MQGDFFEGGDGLVQLSLIPQDEAKIAVSADEFRVELDGLAVARDGLVRLLVADRALPRLLWAPAELGWLATAAV